MADPKPPSENRKQPPEHQRLVDEMQAAIRKEGGAARPSLFKPPPPRPAPSGNILDHRIAEELEFITRQLEQVGALMASDPILPMRHSASLQSIDLMKQSLRSLATVISAEDKSLAASLITLTELKARLVRKPLRTADGESDTSET